MNISFQPLDLELKHTFKISRGAKDSQSNVIVSLTEEGGVSGIGEAAPSLFFKENSTGVVEAFRQFAGLLKNSDIFHIEDITNQLKKHFPANAAARAAIDIALHDLVCKILKIPLSALLGLNLHHTMATSFTIGMDTMEKMCEKIEEVKDLPVLKIKVGCDNDIEILEELRKITRAVFRVDANTGWNKEGAIKRLHRMEELGVELVEQPFPVGDFEALAHIKDKVKIPIFADEEAVDSKDIPRLAGVVDGINIKLMKCGGIREALRMIHTARAHGLKVMIGCNIESSVSITAAAHLMSLADYIDLDGNLLVSNDPYEGVHFEKGRLSLPERDGLGVRLKAG
ncbi:dipeptide epimerase [Candidatus Kuenenia sp.]|uniref:dipeptide epimerase n=1 Tax=Candidatus Kuenenia sp. TaxID=2499824 RepID=UPI00321F77D9